jgi:valyl-tRNA synthetase
VVAEIRQFRADQHLRPGQRMPARLSLPEQLADHHEHVRSLARLAAPGPDFTPHATLSVRGGTVAVDTAGLVDVGAERARLAKDLAAAQKEAQTARDKLAKADFLSRAPEAVVAKVRDRLAVAEQAISRIQAQLDGLPRA